MKIYYSPKYTARSHEWDTTRKAADVHRLLVAEPWDKLDIVEPLNATEPQLERVHSRRYINAVATGHPKDLAESSGLPWCPNTYRSVVSSTGGVIAAARTAVKEGVSGSLSSGLHHAHRDHGGGFCTFNGLVVAAIDALDTKRATNVLIIDFDAHFGDGTADLIDYEPRIHQVCVWSGMFKADYMAQCQSSLQKVEDDDWDLCIYNAGMDPHEDCQLGGRKGVTTTTLAERDRMVFEWCKERRTPTAFVLAGGYANRTFTIDELARCHYNTCRIAAEVYGV